MNSSPVSRVEKVDTLGYFYSISEQKYILTTQLEWNIILLKTKKCRSHSAEQTLKWFA